LGFAFCEQFCYSEVQEADLPVGGYQDIRGFQVAMHDKIRMRVLHGAQHLEEQLQARFDAERLSVAVRRNRLAIHILQREVRLTVIRNASVVQPRDLRVCKLRQNIALAGEAFRQPGVVQGSHREFQGYGALQGAVGAFRQPDHAHAAMPQLANQPVRSDLHPDDEPGRGGFASIAECRQRI
jgi:hypothetical protein